MEKVKNENVYIIRNQESFYSSIQITNPIHSNQTISFGKSESTSRMATANTTANNHLGRKIKR